MLFCDIVVSRILYELTAWGAVQLIAKMDVFLRKAERWHILKRLHFCL